MAGTTPFRWEQVDNSLASLMMSELGEEMQKLITDDQRSLHLRHQGNQNALAHPSERLRMHLDRADQWARRAYEIYCEVWKRQGHVPSAEFLRAVYANVIRSVLSARRNAAVSELQQESWRTNAYPAAWLRARIKEFRRAMERLLASWQGRIEIDAKTIEHQQRALPSAGAKANTVEPLGTTSGIKIAAWESLEITFLSDERVQISNGTNRETRNYAEMGFADGRTGTPNQAWNTLRLFAEKNWVLSSTTYATWPKVEKRVQAIRKVFRQHFGLAGDPIPFVSKVGYKALFTIRCGPSFDA